jgi:hypothetical protein
VLMLSLIGIPPLAGFFGKLYVFMEALNQRADSGTVTLIWLVALGLFNSVVSAFYYVRVLKAMFLREPGTKRLAPAGRPVALPIVLGTIVVILFGIMPNSLMSMMQAASVTMLTDPPKLPESALTSAPPVARPAVPSAPAAESTAKVGSPQGGRGGRGGRMTPPPSDDAPAGNRGASKGAPGRGTGKGELEKTQDRSDSSPASPPNPIAPPSAKRN